MGSDTKADTLLDEINRLKEENHGLRKRVAELEMNPADSSGEHADLVEFIIDHSPAILFRRLAAEKLEDRALVYVSPNISRFGYRAEDLMSGKIMFRDIVYKEDTERSKEEINRYVAEARDQYSQYYRILTSSGETRWVEDRTSVVVDDQGNRYHQGIVIDINERMVAEKKLRASEEKYRQIVETTSEGFVLMDESLKIIDLNSACAQMFGNSVEELLGTVVFRDRSMCGNLLDSGEDTSTGTGSSHAIETRLERPDGTSIPVLIHANTLCSDDGSALGVMAFITDISEQKKALMLAGEVQKSLLPDHPPVIPGLDIAGSNAACEEVGGDYFDYLISGETDRHIAIVVGDISGHGVDSALLMSSARAFLRMRASQPGSGSEIITALNRHLSDDVEESGRFMTMFYLHVDTDRKHVKWIRAGHDPALIYHPDHDEFAELKGPGLALGVDPDYPYTDQSGTVLQDGQIYIIYTDGIWEACNQHGTPYGKERLRQCIRDHAHLDATAILDRILVDQQAFLDGVRNDDDVTLVVAKYREPAT